MQLWWVRHAQAEFNINDKIRKLTDYGIKQAEELANRIAGETVTPKAIYASPYTRAQQTAQIIAQRLNLEVQTLTNITPDSKPAQALAHLECLQQDSLVVTHMPLWSFVYAQLLQEQSFISVPTASVAVFSGDMFITGGVSQMKLMTDLENL